MRSVATVPVGVFLASAGAVTVGVVFTVLGLLQYATRFSSVDHLAGGPLHDVYLETARATALERWMIFGGAGLALLGIVVAIVTALRARRARWLAIAAEDVHG